MFLEPSADKQNRNYDIECSNHHPTPSTLRPKWLDHRKIIWLAIYTNLPKEVIVRLPNLQSGDSQGQETSLAPSADKPTCIYGIEGSNHHPSLSSLRPKGLSHNKMKWWAIHTNLPADIIVKLPHPRSGDSQNQETSLAPSGDKPTRKYDVKCSNHHPSL